MNRTNCCVALASLGFLLASPLHAADPKPEECGHAVCRLKPVEKEIKKTMYSVKCVPYCQSACACCLPCLCHKFCMKCDKPRYRRVLMKRDVVVEKRCEMQCVLEYDPCCGIEVPEHHEFEHGPPPAPAPHIEPPVRKLGRATLHPPDRFE